MEARIKLLIVCIAAACLIAVGAIALAADFAGPQQSTTGPTPPQEVMMRDAEKEFMLLGVPPAAPVVIAGVPDYLWRHGCGPTAVGNVVGYYDSHGFDDLITGDANTQTYDTNQAMASGGDSGNPNPAGSEKHYEDYSRPQDDDTNFPIIADDYITAVRIPHANDCIGDYQDTSKSTRNNRYGWGWSNDLGPSFTGYVNQKNASYNPTYTEYSPVSGNALTWAVLTNEINNNRPMVFLVDSEGDGLADHFVTVVGYDVATSQYGFLDTWNVIPVGIRWETFQGIGNGPWSIWGGWSLKLGQQSGPVTKWEQLPNMTPYGMDVRCDRRDGTKRVLADDFRCEQTGPITRVKLWGSWKSDVNGLIQKIHLSIHSDIPTGPNNPSYSKPGQLLWSRDFNAPNFSESLFFDLTPLYEYWWQPPTTLIQNGDHRIWLYEIPIDPCVAFIQQGSPANPVIYWLDAYVEVNSIPSGTQFGWKTSGETMHRIDDAVWSNNDGNTWNEMRYPTGHPQYMDSVDLAFAIITGQTESNEVNYPTNAKWLQRPDLSSNGLDVKASDPYLILADDFECNKSTLITDITIWGSWRNDYLPPNGADDVWFTLSIHSDIPASQSPNGYSMPNEVLWLKHFTIGEANVSIEREGINEGWWDPYYQEYLPIGDHICWKYVFHIPESEAFCQKGEPNKPIVYWLDVQAHPSGLVSEAQFGWKSSINHWNDDAVWAPGSEPYTGTWNELRYPIGHPLYYQSIDLAFAIEGNIPCITLPEKDLGDAPDSSNNFGATMTAYPSGVVANYPTVYLDPTGLPPFGPIHQQPKGVAWLGGDVTFENEADLLPDQDTITNIDPLNNSPNRDANDDGVLGIPLKLPYCYPTTFKYQVNVVNNTVNLYVNTWFDFNRDGDWDDIFTCGSNTAPEWAVQNQLLPAGSLALGLNTITTPQFRAWHPSPLPTDANIWMRITLSEQPWVGSGSGGSGPATGYIFGETEDYYSPQVTGCLKPTLTDMNEYNAWVKWGEPNCWCFKRQCRGDSNGGKLGAYWVGSNDLNLLRRAINKNDVCLAGISYSGVPGICADFDHVKQGSYRVASPDLNILRKYINQSEVNVPCCDKDANCTLDCNIPGGDRWYFWTN